MAAPSPKGRAMAPPALPSRGEMAPPPLPSRPAMAPPPAKSVSKVSSGVEPALAPAQAPEPAPAPAPPSAYEKPVWSGSPNKEDFPYQLEVLKTGTIIETIDLGGRELFMIGRLPDSCDYTLDHPSISRQHVVIQFKADGEAWIYDMSTHGTRVNKRQLRPRTYAKLGVGDVIQLGQSSRLLILQGPEELMPCRDGGWGYKQREALDEMAAAKARALELKLQRDRDKREGRDHEVTAPGAAFLERQAAGASWGFGDDAEDDDEEEETSDAVSEARRLRDEGKLKEGGQKLLEKIEKRLTKIYNLREEIRKIKRKREQGAGGKEKEQKMREMEDAIGVREEDGGVLTAGQLKAIEKNEAQITKHETDMLPQASYIREQEEALAEMLGLAKKPVLSKSRKMDAYQDDSDDDDFYDRTSSRAKAVDKRTATAQTLASLKEKKENLVAQLQALKDEHEKETAQESADDESSKGLDSMDSYMLDMKRNERLARGKERARQISEMAQEITKTDRLITMATPALSLGKSVSTCAQNRSHISGVHSDTTPEHNQESNTTGASLRAFTFKQFAVTKKPSTSSSTPESIAAAKLLADTVFAAKNTCQDVASAELGADPHESSARVHQKDGVADRGVADRGDGQGAQQGRGMVEGGSGDGCRPDSEKQSETKAQANTAAMQAASAPDEASETAACESLSDGAGLKRARPEPRGAAPGRKYGVARPPQADAEASSVPRFADFQKGGLYRAPKKGKTSGGDLEEAGHQKVAYREEGEEDAVMWVPPVGQSGDGKTALNAKLGY